MSGLRAALGGRMEAEMGSDEKKDGRKATTGAHINTDQVSFSYSTTREAMESYSLHCHNFYEVYLFLEGELEYHIEGNIYRAHPNDIFI